MVTLTTAENALKTVYLGVVSNQLNTKTNPLYNMIKQTTQDVWGKEVKKLAPVGINGGIGAGTEDGTLPTSAQNNYVNFTSTLKNLFGTIEISDKAIRASSNSAGAFVNLLNSEMEGLIKASKFNFGRMLFGDGTGILTTLTPDEDVLTCGVVASTQNLIEGLVCDLVTNKNAVVGTKLRIKSIDRANKKVYFDKILDLDTVTDTIYVTVQNSYKNEITGLDGIFSNATLYGLSKADYGFMKPQSTTSTTIDDIKMQNMIDLINEASNGDVDYIVCSNGVKRAYQKYLNSFRSNIDVLDLKGGYKAISFNGIPLISDRFAKSGNMYFLNTKDFALHQLCDWRWLEGENGNVLKQIAGKPVYTATLVKYAELLCDHPAGQGVITGITEA